VASISLAISQSTTRSLNPEMRIQPAPMTGRAGSYTPTLRM